MEASPISRIKRRRVIAYGLYAALGGLTPAPALAAGPEVPRALRTLRTISPPLRLPDLKLLDPVTGASTTTEIGAGPLVLNLWATWCAPCVEELPSLERLSRLAKGRFRVVLMSQDRGGDAVNKPFLERLKIKELPSFSDPGGSFGRALSVRGLPTTFLVNRSNEIIARYEGGVRWDLEAVVDFIASTTNA